MAWDGRGQPVVIDIMYQYYICACWMTINIGWCLISFILDERAHQCIPIGVHCIINRGLQLSRKIIIYCGFIQWYCYTIYGQKHPWKFVHVRSCGKIKLDNLIYCVLYKLKSLDLYN